MDYGLFHSIATVSAFIAFIAVCWWAYSPKNKKRFDKDAELVFNDQDPVAESADTGEKNQSTGETNS